MTITEEKVCRRSLCKREIRGEKVVPKGVFIGEAAEASARDGAAA